MPTVFNLDKDDKDPLELIVRNTGIVRHLRGNGIDGMEIKNILHNYHGLKMEMPVSRVGMEEYRKEQRQIDYARRHTLALIRNPAITDEERESLIKINSRLSSEYYPLDIDKAGQPIVKISYPGDDGGETDVKAKSMIQAYGFQVLLLHECIKNYNTTYLQKDIFNLIAELFEAMDRGKFDLSRISNFYKNNLKFL